jgi:beta-glucosidase/6-phospho-beta-glucosidase/beta-galactosidase
MYGWFMDPLTKGEYPQTMRDTVGSRLPSFTTAQQKLVTGSIDFVALNYYFPYMTEPGTLSTSDSPSYWKDENTTLTFNSTWPLSQTGWGIYGPGLKDLLLYTKENYNNIPMYITENGLAWEEDNIRVAINDEMRQQYLHDHIQAVGDALAGGANVKGYFIWSFEVSCSYLFCFILYIGCNSSHVAL